jgi:hypothetical protein
MFDQEKLQVYGKALDFAAKAAAGTSTWDKNMPWWIISTKWATKWATK